MRVRILGATISLSSLSLGAAEALVEPLAGSSGWVGAGLLGLVLFWLLFKGLPDKDRQLKVLTDSKDKQIRELLVSKDAQILTLLNTREETIKALVDTKDTFIRELTGTMLMNEKEQRRDYATNLTLVTEHCQKEAASLAAATRVQFQEITHALTDLRQVMEEYREDTLRRSPREAR